MHSGGWEVSVSLAMAFCFNSFPPSEHLESKMKSQDLSIWTSKFENNKLAHDCLRFEFDILFETSTTPLCAAMNRFGSDKGSHWHNYTKLYDYLLNESCHTTKFVFELGLGTNNIDTPSNMGMDGRPGASLRAWRAYFPNADIYGADIDRRVLFEETRIKTFYCDQTNPADIAALWKSMPGISFDLMIDDGLHEFQANKLFLQHSIGHLADGGLYVIEDVSTNEQSLQLFKQLLSDLDMPSVILKLPHEVNNSDNCLILIKNLK
jgi:hypothetical protein